MKLGLTLILPNVLPPVEKPLPEHPTAPVEPQDNVELSSTYLVEGVTVKEEERGPPIAFTLLMLKARNTTTVKIDNIKSFLYIFLFFAPQRAGYLNTPIISNYTL